MLFWGLVPFYSYLPKTDLMIKPGKRLLWISWAQRGGVILRLASFYHGAQ